MSIIILPEIYGCIIDATLRADMSTLGPLALTCRMFAEHVRVLFPLILRAQLCKHDDINARDLITLIRNGQFDDVSRQRGGISVSHNQIYLIAQAYFTRIKVDSIMMWQTHILVTGKCLTIGFTYKNIGNGPKRYVINCMSGRWRHDTLCRDGMIAMIYSVFPELSPE